MKPASVWRSQPQRYRLEAARCSACGTTAYPPRLVCAACGKRGFETVTLCPSGRIVSYTVLHVAGPQFADETPLPVGIIELDDGVRLTAQLVDFPEGDPAIGKRVRLIFRKVQAGGESGVIAYAHKAAPAE